MMRVLVAPDKFKGCMSATTVCAVLAAALQDRAEITARPISDGGEGFTATMQAALGGTAQSVSVRDPLGRPLTTTYATCGSIAVMEMASASGLALLTASERDPWRASTFGTGEMIRAAAHHGAAEILLGIGGSATNDGGVGMALALGFQFLDASGQSLRDLPARLMEVRRILPPERPWPPILVACDVENPLLGPHGCTQIYGPQKGIHPKDFARHEARLAHLVTLLGIESTPGSGAAGGLGYGLVAFAQAELVPGFALVAQALHLETLVQAADLILTGEGRLDASSLSGKAPAALAHLAQKHHKPIIALCGSVEPTALPALRRLFTHIVPITPPGMDLPTAFSQALALLAETARNLSLTGFAAPQG